MINVGLNNNNAENYVYLINAALVFVVLYGGYALPFGQSVYFESKPLVCGETATFYIPHNACGIGINVDASYIYWANIYRRDFGSWNKNLCLLATGVLFETRCDEIACNSAIPPAMTPNTPLTYAGCPSANNCLNNNCNMIRKDASKDIIYSSASNSRYASMIYNNSTISNSNYPTSCNKIDASSNIIYGSAMNKCK